MNKQKFHALRITNHESRLTNEHGLSLISTLWILAILSVLATQFLHSIRLEQRAQANFADRTKFHYAAKAGFERSVAIMRDDETPHDALTEDWAQDLEEQLEDGVIVGNLLTYQVKVSDESTKININTADADLIGGLLGMVGYEEQAPEESLAEAIVQGRPYRTVRDLARVEGMTQELLYGQQQQTEVDGISADAIEDESEEGQNTQGLVDLVTVHSIDKNTDANGQQRVNIKSAEAQALTQLTRSDDNQPVFTQDEAQSLTQQRDNINTIGDLLNLQAVSDETFNNIQERISVDSETDDEELININSADESQLQTLDGIDQGIAQRIVEHRNNQQFQNVDALKEVKLVSNDEFKNIVDKITIVDDETISGLININTAAQNILQMLPGMDETKAQAIIDRRESAPEDAGRNQGNDEESEGNPFTNIGQLLDVQGIDADTFRQIAGLVTYRSHSYRIESTAIDARGKTIATCVGVIDRTGQQIAIKYWKQN